MCQNAHPMEPGTDDSPREFLDGLKLTIFRRRIGQIALAVVLAEACIRYLNSLVWYLVIPIISNVLANHTESVLLENRRKFPLEQLAGNTLDFAAALIFVYFANRWIYNLSRPRPDKPETDTVEIPPTALTEGDEVPARSPHESEQNH
jgi:large-conductance mechanosensitive channel